METVVFVLLIVVAALVFAAAITGTVLVLLRGSAGAWRRLVDAYPSAAPPAATLAPKQTLQIGPVRYKRCVTVGVADDGLYLAIGKRSALVPWAEVKSIGRATLYWQNAPVLTVGDPPLATIAVPAALFEPMRAPLARAGHVPE